MSAEVTGYLSVTYSGLRNPAKHHMLLEEPDISVIFLFIYLPEYWLPDCIPSPFLGL